MLDFFEPNHSYKGRIIKDSLAEQTELTPAGRGRRRLLGLFTAPFITSAANLFLPPSEALAESRILDVSFYKQKTDGSCARAAVCSVVNYYNAFRYIDEPDVVNALPEFAHLTQHVVPSIKKLTNGERLGDNFKTGPSTWLNLVKSEIRAGRPLLVLIPNGTYLDWNWSRAHYVVIRGFDDNDNIHFVDPWKDPKNNGFWQASKDYFARAWGAPQNSFQDAFGWQGVKTPRLYTA